MKLYVRKILIAALSIALSAVLCLNCIAASANEYGIGLSTQTDASDSSALNVKLRNSNDFDVNDIILTVETDGSISLNGADSTFPVGTLAAGEAFEQSLSFCMADTAEQTAIITYGEAGTAEKEDNGSHKAIILAAAIAVVLIAGVIILFRRHKKAAALILAFSLLVPSLGMFGVHAIGAEETRSFSLKEIITVDGKDYGIGLTVEFTATSEKNSYFDFDITDSGQAEQESSQDSPAVTRPNTSISGSAKADGSVKEVSYEVFNDNYKDTVTGTAELDGCEWNAQTIPLREGENEIVFTAELDSGEALTQIHKVSYDAGEIYKPLELEIVSDNNTVYVENVINIYFDNDTSAERIEEILAEQKLVRIGESNGIRLVQARANVETLEELREICEKLTQGYTEITLAEIEEVLDIEINSVPNDPWYHDAVSNPVKWSETAPGGTNWSVEAVEALSAWEYEKYFSTAHVGIIDSGFHTSHEDFGSFISFPDSLYKSYNSKLTLKTKEHGTHVTGIIGATRNNALGGSGLLSDLTVHAAPYTYGESSTIGNIVRHLDTLVTAGAKAVNLSIGLNPIAYDTPYSESDLKSGSAQCAAAMNTLLNEGYEFVVVQSAGNGALDDTVGTLSVYNQLINNPYRSIDAYQNGLFCSIKENAASNYYGSLSASQVKAVYDRIIVVGAVTHYYCTSAGPEFRMWYRSNGGDRVDIYAPGHNVFSTIPDTYDETTAKTYYYAYMSGTSQAAPFVTAIAALCFSIKSDFTGAQVKNIICDPENSTHIAYDAEHLYTNSSGNTADLHPFTGNSQVISMKLCAEAALRYVCGRASYTYFNQAMAAVNRLDPNAYTNYDVLQAVLDTIDEDFYNLYEFEQSKVSAKTNEIIAAMDKLDEKDKADYTAVDEAVAKANALNPDHYVDFSAVTQAVNAVVYGKYADEQDEVDLMAQNINNAIDSLEKLIEISSSSSCIIPDNDIMCIVTTVEYINDISKHLSAGSWTLEHKPDENGSYSTGSTVVLTDESGTQIVYPVAIIGDIDSDGDNDAEDAYLVSLCVAGIAPEPEATLFPAYDADCSGVLDEYDVTLLNETSLKENDIINSYWPGGNS